MRSSWLPSGLAWLALALPAAVRAQAAPGWREVGVWGAAVFQRPAFYGAGISLAFRDAGRTRLQLAAAEGVEDGRGAAARVEAVWHFLLDPWKQRGDAVYGGGGLALAVDHDGRLRPGLQLVLGMEGAPGTPRGTFIEAGFGRGVRIAVGMRWRTRASGG